MSCSWCTNRSFMVLMSLVKSPIAPILFVWGTHSDAFVVAAAPICSIADVTLTGGSRGCSCCLRKRRAMEQEHREKWNGRTAAARDWNFGRCGISTACDTRPRSKAEAGVVKDCTTTRFCLMGLCKWSDWPPLAIDPFDGLSIVAAPPGGRMHRLLTTLGRGFKKRIGWKGLGDAPRLLL